MLTLSCAMLFPLCLIVLSSIGSCVLCRDIEKIAVKLGQIMEGGEHPYQALDGSAMPIRDVKRRGHGWLAGYADIGWSNSLGWYEGFCCDRC